MMIKYIDKSRFYDKDSVSGETGDIILRLDITDTTGQPRGGLAKEDFQVLEEGLPGASRLSRDQPARSQPVARST